DQGSLSITLLAPSIYTQTAGDTQTTYFVVVKIRADAVENSDVRKFSTYLGSCVIEDAELDLPLKYSLTSERCHVVLLEAEPWLFEFSQPQDNALVSGTQSVDITCAETPGRVEYWAVSSTGGSYSLTGISGTQTIVYRGSGTTQFNFEYLWNTKIGTFTDGTWTLVAEAYDSNGSSQATDTVSVEIDNTPGTLTIISPTLIWVKPGDIITVVYSYTEENPDKLIAKVSDGTNTIGIAELSGALQSGTPTGTITVGISSSAPNGSWTLTLTLIDKVSNTFIATQTNAIKVDGTAPILGTPSPTGTIGTDTPTLICYFSDGFSGVDTLTLTMRLDGTICSSFNGSYTLGINYVAWKGSSSLTQDIHNVTCDVKDKAGNSANQLSFVFLVDLSAGHVVLDKPESRAIISGTTTINLIECSANTSYIKYSISTGTTWIDLGTESDPSGGYDYLWNTNLATFTDGSNYYVRAIAYDSGNNPLGTDTHTNITVDNATPTVGVIAVDGGQITYKKQGSSVDVAYSYTEANPSTLIIEIATGTTIIARESLAGLSGSVTTIYGTQSVAILYTASEGTYSVRVILTDTSGKSKTATLTDSVIIDNIAPTGSITIANNATYTNTGSITYQLYHQGAKYYRLSPDGVSWANWLSVGALPTLGSYFLTFGDGEKWLYAELIDSASNTITVTDSIILDTVSPLGCILINNNDPYTNNATITLT
ncbi:MAG: hypothetical protein AAB296_10810, partial [Candidatus Desantisbacteria bacterium]